MNSTGVCAENGHDFEFYSMDNSWHGCWCTVGHIMVNCYEKYDDLVD